MAQFSSSFHRNSLLRTKQYLAGSLFPSSAVWTRSGKMNTLTEAMPGPIDPYGPAAPDAIVIAVGIVSEDQLKVTLQLATGQQNDPVFAADFPVCIAALNKQQNSVSKTGINKWLLVKDGNDDAIRFSFKVLNPRLQQTKIQISISKCGQSRLNVEMNSQRLPNPMKIKPSNRYTPYFTPGTIQSTYARIVEKRKASKEPEGSSTKHVNTGEAEVVPKIQMIMEMRKRLKKNWKKITTTKEKLGLEKYR
ncbi:hypothetical protein B0H14DRAFT_3165164 [Mycena olivaceomarginata]|nr:hypothetical protein B0H14DRAFT_3165164 [Mycena olivaceomarginata]